MSVGMRRKGRKGNKQSKKNKRNAKEEKIRREGMEEKKRLFFSRCKKINEWWNRK